MWKASRLNQIGDKFIVCNHQIFQFKAILLDFAQSKFPQSKFAQPSSPNAVFAQRTSFTQRARIRQRNKNIANLTCVRARKPNPSGLRVRTFGENGIGRTTTLGELGLGELGWANLVGRT